MISSILRNQRKRRGSALNALDRLSIDNQKRITIFHEHLRSIRERHNMSLSLITLANNVLRNSVTSRNGLTSRNSLIHNKGILSRIRRRLVGDGHRITSNLICGELASIISDELSIIHEGLELILNHISLRLAALLRNGSRRHRVLGYLEDRLNDFVVHFLSFCFYVNW